MTRKEVAHNWWEPNRRNWFGWAALLLTAIIAILWLGNTPLHTDDFYYQYMPGPDDNTSMWLHKGDKITSFSQVPEAIYNHRLNVNGRMSNAAYLAVQPLPMWVVRYFCGFVLALLAWMLWRWCGRTSLRNNTLAIAIPLLLWTGLQWNDQMQSADFQFNYTITSVLLIACAMYFFQRKKSPGWIGWTLLAVFAVWHECFTIVFGVFLGVQWLFRRDRQTFIAVCVLIVGALFQFSAGTQDRLGVNLDTASEAIHYFPWSRLIGSGWLSLVAVVWWLIRRRKVSVDVRRSLDRFGLGLIGSWVAGLMFIMVLAAPQRAHWANDVLAILFTLNILRTYRPIKPSVWVKVTLLSLYVAWGATLIYWQIRVTKMTNYSIEQLSKGNNVVVDRDGISSANIPFWLMEMTHLQYTPFDPWEYYSMPCVVTDNKSIGYLIVPEGMENKPFDEWPKFDGNTDIRIGGGTLLTRRHDGRNYKTKRLKITFGAPTLSTSPIDYLIGKLKGDSDNTISIRLRVFTQNSIVVGNDTIDILNLEKRPRSTKGRPIIAINEN